MNIENNDLLAQKADIRTRLKQIRASLSPDERQISSRSITQKTLELDAIKTAQRLFIYISYGTEVDTHELIDVLQEQGKSLAVPKIIDSHKMIAVTFTTWNDLEAGQLGILTPKNTTPMNADIDIAITPGLGFTQKGYRIGYGRGYYDKWFAEHPVKHKFALAFEAQILDELPVDEFDIPVNKIITENQIITI